MVEKDPLTKEQILDVLIEAGWPPELLRKAFIIAWMESSFDPTDVKDYKEEESFGLFQITTSNHIDKLEALGDNWRELALDPVTNAKLGLAVYLERVGWNKSGAITGDHELAQRDPWLAWTSHKAQLMIGDDYSLVKKGNSDAKADYWQGIEDNTIHANDLWQQTKGPSMTRGMNIEESVFEDPSNVLRTSQGKYPTTDGGLKFASPPMTTANEVPPLPPEQSSFEPEFIQNEQNFNSPFPAPPKGAIGATENMVQ
tara:strand:- start:689 stop:1456 length:768 start_codon:yes stop_codon:yes gene_type:complete